MLSTFSLNICAHYKDITHYFQGLGRCDIVSSMQIKHIVYITAFALLSYSSAPAYGEFLCRADTSYSWAKETTVIPAGEKETPTITRNEMKVFWTSSEATGEDEEKAKSALMMKLESEREKARESCKKEHENVAFCIASKFSAMKSVLQQLDFEARRTLRDSIANDCTSQQGHCQEAVSGEPACKNLTHVVEGEGDGEKDEKGKGKKKKKK
ncbi:MAG: hypothetical protein KDD55_00220 [Bdellovibrionales bacterium]|nr:hypothetical protein [Bdellovibrionales bacterium]